MSRVRDGTVDRRGRGAPRLPRRRRARRDSRALPRVSGAAACLTIRSRATRLSTAVMRAHTTAGSRGCCGASTRPRSTSSTWPSAGAPPSRSCSASSANPSTSTSSSATSTATAGCARSSPVLLASRRSCTHKRRLRSGARCAPMPTACAPWSPSTTSPSSLRSASRPGSRSRRRFAASAVPTLEDVDLVASTLLANSDRAFDDAVFSRDLIDLALMRPPRRLFASALEKAKRPNGDAVARDLRAAVSRMQARPGRLQSCLTALQMTSTSPARAWAAIRRLPRLLPDAAGA